MGDIVYFGATLALRNRRNKSYPRELRENPQGVWEWVALNASASTSNRCETTASPNRN
jgi:hypothetical protein